MAIDIETGRDLSTTAAYCAVPWECRSLWESSASYRAKMARKALALAQKMGRPIQLTMQAGNTGAPEYELATLRPTDGDREIGEIARSA